jgi:hypothetical protein
VLSASASISRSESPELSAMISGDTPFESSVLAISVLPLFIPSAKPSALPFAPPGSFPQKSYTPHSFRHTTAMHMLDSGIPLPVIKAFLGHTSIATTMVYAAADFELVSRYLKDKDPYAVQEIGGIQEQSLVLPAFLR